MPFTVWEVPVSMYDSAQSDRLREWEARPQPRTGPESPGRNRLLTIQRSKDPAVFAENMMHGTLQAHW